MRGWGSRGAGRGRVRLTARRKGIAVRPAAAAAAGALADRPGGAAAPLPLQGAPRQTSSGCAPASPQRPTAARKSLRSASAAFFSSLPALADASVLRSKRRVPTWRRSSSRASVLRGLRQGGAGERQGR
jgi:hypothetical protein